jgi:hypothetical protein
VRRSAGNHTSECACCEIVPRVQLNLLLRLQNVGHVARSELQLSWCTIGRRVSRAACGARRQKEGCEKSRGIKARFDRTGGVAALWYLFGVQEVERRWVAMSSAASVSNYDVGVSRFALTSPRCTNMARLGFFQAYQRRVSCELSTSVGLLVLALVQFCIRFSSGLGLANISSLPLLLPLSACQNDCKQSGNYNGMVTATGRASQHSLFYIFVSTGIFVLALS